MKLMRVVGIVATLIGLIAVVLKGGATSIVVGKGISFVLVAAIGSALVRRYPDRVHASLRRGAYLSEGHAQRHEVVYPEGSSKRKTRTASFIGAASGAAIIALSIYVGEPSWWTSLVSSALFASGIIISAPGPIERLLVVNNTLSEAALVLVIGGAAWFLLGIGAAVGVVLFVHGAMIVITGLPGSRAMIEAAKAADRE